MNLYLLSQTENDDYDTYDSAVVCAPDEETARMIHPGTETVLTKETWPTPFCRHEEWASNPNKVKLKLLGEAIKGSRIGVICSSYNA